MIAPKRRLTNHALHGREEWVKRIFRDQIAEAAGILEVVLSGIVLAALLMSIVPLVELMPGLLTDADSLEIRTFLERALDIVIGIEFIKMLAKHSPGSVLESGSPACTRLTGARSCARATIRSAMPRTAL